MEIVNKQRRVSHNGFTECLLGLEQVAEVLETLIQESVDPRVEEARAASYDLYEVGGINAEIAENPELGLKGSELHTAYRWYELENIGNVGFGAAPLPQDCGRVFELGDVGGFRFWGWRWRGKSGEEEIKVEDWGFGQEWNELLRDRGVRAKED